MSSNANGHAVVIGGSIAGLVAARALSEHFARVTIVERDAAVRGAVPRRGVPQGRHVHGLLVGGERVLSRWFPDLTRALVAAGGTPVDMGRDLRWRHFGHWKARFTSGIEAYLASRPLLEEIVAERVRARSGVTVRDRCVVDRLVATADARRVTGVVLHDLAGDHAEALDAELVVDATGRGSRLPSWLDTLGYAAPPESRVVVDLAYVSRTYRRPAGERSWKALFVVPKPPARRGAFIAPIEGDRWLATLTGTFGDHPPTDTDGWLEFARTLEVPDVYDALAQAEPLTAPVAHKLPHGLRRHYERLARLPDGLVALGDAVCSFNPVYGQGMTVAALGAQLLDECLREARAENRDLAGFPLAFQRRLARIVDVPWQLATLEDLRYREVPGRRSLRVRALHAYTARVHAAAAHDREVARRFYRLMNLLEPPSTIMRPGTALRVLRPARMRPGTRRSAETHALLGKAAVAVGAGRG